MAEEKTAFFNPNRFNNAINGLTVPQETIMYRALLYAAGSFSSWHPLPQKLINGIEDGEKNLSYLEGIGLLLKDERGFIKLNDDQIVKTQI